MCPILDSGERRTFPTGSVRDIQEGKGRCDLLPLDVIADIYRFAYGECEEAEIIEMIYNFTQTNESRYLIMALSGFSRFEVWPDAFLEVSKHFEEGAKKYGEGNWTKGIPTHCYIDSAVRHYLKWLRGDEDEPHDRAFCWNILCCIWTCLNKPELNDYGKGQNNDQD